MYMYMYTFDLLFNHASRCGTLNDLLQDRPLALVILCRLVIFIRFRKLRLLQKCNPRILWNSGNELLGNSLEQSCSDSRFNPQSAKHLTPDMYHENPHSTSPCHCGQSRRSAGLLSIAAWHWTESPGHRILICPWT